MSQDFESYPLADAIDHDILMHRDAHFGGLFGLMLDYYKRGGKGVQPDFSIERIEELAELEKQTQQNLSALYLEGAEAERVAEAKQAYKTLRAIYELKDSKISYPKLIADLILSEEEEPKEAIQAIVDQKAAIVPSLIDLLQNEQFHDSLFPGYGQAPSLAVLCLERIGDKRAIISLFQAIGQDDFFVDDNILKALKAIGEPAKAFLLQVVKKHPINEDNERAAIALIQFKDDPEVAKTCFNLLQDRDVQKDPCLPTYLVLACSALKGTPLEEPFRQMSEQPSLSRSLREDIKAIIHEWE